MLRIPTGSVRSPAAPWIVLLPALLFGCDGSGPGERSAQAQDAPAKGAKRVTEALCVLQPTEGNEVRGTVTFTTTADGIRVQADVEGLTPGLHGFHVHEVGDVSCADGTCTKGHFNPTDSPHGAPDAAERHVGDLGNLDAGEEGRATYERVDSLIQLNGAHSIVGRAIIVHEKADDLKSQPTGDAGGRLAYGVVGIRAEK